MNRHYFLVAGEESGDRLGAGLMAGIRSIDGGARFSGVGGAEMSRAGLTSLFDQNDLAVMGIAEILPRLPTLISRIKTTADAAVSSGADVLITIDSPDFSLRVARRVRSARPEMLIVQYVAPSVWAWRAGRTKRMQGIVDLVLTLLPFEPELFRSSGIEAGFVGHPAAELPQPRIKDESEIRRQLRIGDTDPILLALPGSRKTEIKRLAPVFGSAAARFVDCNPCYRVVVPVADSVSQLVRRETAKWKVDTRLFFPARHSKRQKAALFAASSLALAASGTVTLELAAARTPTVVAYDVNWLSRMVISKLLRTETVTIANVVLGAKVVPELLGTRCGPQPITEELERLRSDPDAQNCQFTAFDEVLRRLRAPSGNSRQAAAQAVIDLIREREKQ